ncbi:LOW QUALITY PROTEIN: high affinity immunoglobulin alpha and immunoglobulin mu Fc receptor, partial [Acomys russatus]|uniref:LOW QUALITY PROTEIN: high affinity immunoglobulin alpha and immunoglobulin mu Fc receptor n=1 Tax=Acomys russatus TaxID=60746 RepID=UPI0021E2D3C6
PFLCLFSLPADANALRGPRLVSGETGGAVTIHCHYAPSSVNRHQRKYWCRLRPPLWVCHTIASTNRYTHRDYHGRVALTDFPQNGLFRVRLSQLSRDDTGLYRCGIGDRNDMLFFSMNLIVSTGPSNTTYAAAPASTEPITASGTASVAANRWTSEVTQSLEDLGSGWSPRAPTTGISNTTSSANGKQTLRKTSTTVPWTSSREDDPIKATVSTPESSAPKPRSVFSTTQDVWIWGSRNSVTTSVSAHEGRNKGTTLEAYGPQEEAEVSTSPDAPRKTTGATRPPVLHSEHVTQETLQEGTKVSKQQMLYSTEEKSPPAPSVWTWNTTHMEVASGGGSNDGSLENTAEEHSPSTRSQLPAVGSTWVPGKGSSMKSAFIGEESNSWILTPIFTVLALVLLAALVLLKRSVWRERTSQEAERVPRITLIQMTHFLPDKLSDVGTNLWQDDLPPTQASLTVLEDPGP